MSMNDPKPEPILCVDCGKLHEPHRQDKTWNWQWDNDGHPLWTLESAREYKIKFPNGPLLKGLRIEI